MQNRCKYGYFLNNGFPELSGDSLGLLHGCCTCDARAISAVCLTTAMTSPCSRSAQISLHIHGDLDSRCCSNRPEPEFLLSPLPNSLRESKISPTPATARTTLSAERLRLSLRDKPSENYGLRLRAIPSPSIICWLSRLTRSDAASIRRRKL